MSLLQTILNAVGELISPEPKGRGSKWRDVKTGRFTTGPVLYRFSYGLKWEKAEYLKHVIPFHSRYPDNRYYGALIQIWTYSKDDVKLEEARDELWDYLEEFLGYPPEEWWFPIDDGWGWQEVPLKDAKPGTVALRIEDQDGRSIISDERRL
jgi:hypothetical protein